MPHESAHTVQSYEQELEQLRSLVNQMGGLVERQVAQAITAVVEHDEVAALDAPEMDPQVDELERETEALVIRLLALRAPMAGDLREVVVALKISGDLERIGDCAASIARRAMRNELLSCPISLTGLHSMGRLVQENLRRTIDAMDQRDPELARLVWHSDTAVDELYVSLFRELVIYMMEDPAILVRVRTCCSLPRTLSVLATMRQIFPSVYYAVTGNILPIVRPRGKTFD